MDIQLLRAFIALSDELHFGNAAKRLHCSQPTLSQQITRLEQMTNAALFERNTRAVRLTTNGLQLLPIARDTVESADHFMAQARGIAHTLTGTVRIGYAGFGPTRYLPKVLARLEADHPGVTISLTPHLFAGRAFEALRNRQVDFAIFRPDNIGAEYERLAIVPDEVHAIMPIDHPLADAAEISVRDLTDERIISFPSTSHGSVRAEIERAAAEQDTTLTITHEVADVLMAIAMAQEGLGITYAFDSTLDFPHDGVAFVPIAGLRLPPVSVVWKRKKHPDKLERAVLAGFTSILEDPD